LPRSAWTSAGDIDRDAILAVPGSGQQLADKICNSRDDLRKPLVHFQNELKKSARRAQVQERRLATMAARLSAHDGEVAAAVAAAAVAEINHRTGWLLPKRAA
jgi:hypothetical protein